MTARAFILSRPDDYHMARACAVSLHAQGWLPHILLDPSEWPFGCPPGTIPSPYAPERRMVGNACHEAIIAAMVENSSPGEIIGKFDCDIRLTPAAAAWLAAVDGPSRTLLHNSQLWGGMWAAERESVRALSAHAPRIPRCRCAESHLAICGLHRFGGLIHHPQWHVAIWGHDKRPDSIGGYTLPRTVQGAPRLTAGLAMINQS